MTGMRTTTNGRMSRKRQLMASTAVATVAAVILAACGSGSSGGSSAGKTYTLELSTFSGPGAVQTALVDKLVEKVNKNSDGRVKINVHYSESLTPFTENLQATKDGRTDMSFMGDAFYPKELPLSGAVGIPFTTDRPVAAMRSFMKLYEDDKTFSKQWEDQGVHVIFYFVGPPATGGFTSAVNSVDDLKGKRLRSVGFVTNALDTIGAEPVALAPAEIYESIQRKVIDGYAGLNIDIVPSLSLDEVLSHVYDMGIGIYGSGQIVINKEVWEDMPEDIQSAFNDASASLMDEVAGIYSDSATKACDDLIKAGVKVARLDQGVIDQWHTATDAQITKLYQQRVADGGLTTEDADAFLDSYKKLLADNEKDASGDTDLQKCAAKAGS